MNNKLIRGRIETAKKLTKVMTEIKASKQQLNEHKLTLTEGKKLLSQIQEYKKLTNRYRGYNIIMELFGWHSALPIAAIGSRKNEPVEYETPFTTKSKIATIVKLLSAEPLMSIETLNLKLKAAKAGVVGPKEVPAVEKIREAIRRISPSKRMSAQVFNRVVHLVATKNSSNELGTYVANVIKPQIEKAYESIKPTNLEKVELAEIDEAADIIGQTTKFFEDYVTYFKDKSSGMGDGSHKVNLKNVKQAVHSLKSAFKNDPGLDVQLLARQITNDPEILDDNKDIATTSELIEIPALAKRAVVNAGVFKTLGNFLSGFGRAAAPSVG